PGGGVGRGWGGGGEGMGGGWGGVLGFGDCGQVRDSGTLRHWIWGMEDARGYNERVIIDRYHLSTTYCYPVMLIFDVILVVVTLNLLFAISQMGLILICPYLSLLNLINRLPCTL